MRTLIRKGLCALIGCMVAAGAIAQAPPEGGRGGPGGRAGRGGPGGRGGRPRFDPARMQQMMMERLKKTLEATDEEWQALEPMVGEVLNKRRDLMVGRMGRRRRDNAEDDTFPEATALRESLEAEDAKPEDIKAKLAAYRAAKQKKTDDLKAAEDALKKVLTAKQEATLVLRGIID